MRKILQSTLLLVALATPAVAAPASDFYLTLLRRGVADLEGGRSAEAVTNLRLAAFGLLDSVEHYETAQAYLAVALDRAGQPELAADAARRIVAAEKIEKKFRDLALPAAIRTAFEAVAKRALPASDVAALSGGVPAKVAEPVVVDRVDVVTEKRSGAATSTPATPQPSQQPAVKPQPETPPAPTPKTQAPAPKTGAVTYAPPAARRPDPAAQFTAAERALTTANIDEARRIYQDLFAKPGLDRAGLIRVAEGFYRTRDFTNTLLAFDRAGALRSGEEPYRYYIAVAAYEVGQLDRARRELAAALPWIEVTPDVQRYRQKIEAPR